MRDRRHPVDDLREQRGEAPVHDEHLVARVIDDVGEVIGREPHVDGVQHTPGQRSRVVDLEMGLAVRGEGADPRVGSGAQRVQRRSEASHPHRPLPNSRHPVAVAIGSDDACVAEHPLRTMEHVTEGERPVLHLADHVRSSRY